MSRSTQRISSHAGFTLLELLFVVFIVGVLLFYAIVAMERMRPKFQLTGAAQELAVAIQRARMVAIRQQRPVRIFVQNTFKDASEIEAWELPFNPTGIEDEFFVFVTREPDGTESEFFSYRLPKAYRPVFVWGPTEAQVQQASANTFDSDDVVINVNATADEAGAFRLSYPISDAPARNTLEVAFTTQGSQPVIRKFLLPGDRPMTAAGQEFFPETIASLSTAKNLWTWY